jgi:hypothetical protein
MEDINSIENKFKQQVSAMHSKGKSMLMSKEEYFSLIEELRQASNESGTKTNRQYYILKG